MSSKMAGAILDGCLVAACVADMALSLEVVTDAVVSASSMPESFVCLTARQSVGMQGASTLLKVLCCNAP
ncbi:hypothetical protein [Caballeronia novacaledonica]|uniref:hypothetical protein n=1 Tax=Caballeronia novacaledonica TaxID=1544861 RepID=UPI0016565DB7|nr:hypothetical protein [Caballeronia novacaledonica]